IFPGQNHKTPIPINYETSRVIIDSSSINKIMNDKITVTQLFAEAKLYLRGVRNDVDLSKAIDLSQ
ncbi:MAG TPA: hypothetical protein DCS13_02760, partial [Candidatus Margulisbacteria bacterium]|nr:hypothetical protein [Candidatus Margulisiibacteriota bacterium]